MRDVPEAALTKLADLLFSRKCMSTQAEENHKKKKPMDSYICKQNTNQWA